MDLMSLLSGAGNSVFYVVAFILALSIIVTIHEYGHYIVGRWSGIRADVFSLGFGKALVQRTDKRGTVWQISAVPLGGYVKFAGDANAASAPDSQSVEGLSAEEARHTMPGAPLWARTATVAAGPVFNFIFSFLVFACFALFSGAAGNKLVIAETQVMPTPVPLEIGDEILTIDGQPVPEMAELMTFVDDLPRVTEIDYTVLRDGAEVALRGPHPFPVIVNSISPKSAARDAGLKVGDVITHLNGTPSPAFRGLQEYVTEQGGAPLELTVWRDGESFDTTLTPRSRDLPTEDGFEQRWLIGISGGYLFTVKTEGFLSLPESLGYGAQQVWYLIKTSLSAMKHMITGAISVCNMSGPIGIADAVGTMAAQGAVDFIWVVAMISTAIGLMNLLPIPVLDGGHLVFYAYEAVRGKPLPDRAVNVMMTAGLLVIACFMVLGLGADLFCI